LKLKYKNPAELRTPSLISLQNPSKVLTLGINNTIHNRYHQEFVRCQICSITRAVRCTYPCQFILLVAKMTHCAKTGGIAVPSSYPLGCCWIRFPVGRGNHNSGGFVTKRSTIPAVEAPVAVCVYIDFLISPPQKPFALFSRPVAGHSLVW
jgi:hypothetical protein